LPSYIVNRITAKLVGVRLRDYGCMLKAYRRNIVDYMNMCPESSRFIPALANTFAKRITEIEVGHEERKKGTSKYSPFKLFRLNFDLMTNISPAHTVHTACSVCGHPLSRPCLRHFPHGAAAPHRP
jgi:undecaprenyl-phosphate 4-deoxy-4-formamido-L-arabinose transferase